MKDVGQNNDTGAQVAVNVYASRGKLTVVAPMPGLEPEDIVVSVGNDVLAIRGEMRGELQEGKSYLIHEWQVGPYVRVLALPFPIDGSRANLTYNNGILVASFPEATETVPGRLHLNRVNATSGERAGWTGVDAWVPSTSGDEAGSHRPSNAEPTKGESTGRDEGLTRRR